MTDGAVDLICLGEAMIEFNHRRDGSVVRGFGGDTSNCAIAAARQGARVGYLSAVGNDEHGRALTELWTREGVDGSHVTVSDAHPTGYYTITHGDDGHAFSYKRSGSAASHYHASALPEHYIASARVLHVSGISQAISATASETVRAAIAIARRHGVQVSYDTNLRLKLWSLDVARDAIHAAVAECDIVLPGLEDARQLTGERDPDRIVDFYRALGPHTVVLTLGADGVLIATGERRLTLPRLDVALVDATAAGDTFDGAFLAALIDGDTVNDAARYANAAAALSVTRYGAVDSIPYREEVMRFARSRA